MALTVSSAGYYNAAIQPVGYRAVLTAQATLVACTLERHMPECRGPSVDRQAVPLRVSVAIGDAALDHPVARNGAEPRNDLYVLADSLLILISPTFTFISRTSDVNPNVWSRS